jgi:hypothetical protein
MAGVGSAASSSARSAEHRTIRVDSTVTELNLVDVAPAGESLGDEIVFSNRLVKDEPRFGTRRVCTTVSLERHDAQCVATFPLPGGQITPRAWSAW